MIKTLTLSSVIFFSFFSNGQEIDAWKTANPNVILIEKKDASDDFLKLLELKNQNYIIYDHELNEDDIVKYNLKNNVKTSILTENELTEIKIWKANHPNTILLSQEEFDRLSPQKKEVYQQQELIIYQNEELLLTQIRTYDQK